ncbi:MAG: DNA mismatch repair protein MutL [Petrotoga mobilis]|nr:MAG: DNA mismatch repair protein MutL [Petrotoga mobilis]
MRIKVLNPEVVMKIAAGEVVSGPSSVVKELVENSLDALANNISVEILNGGKSLISVDDNGIGMEEEELELSILPHTTSKIFSIEDLYKLKTFGFRGEALSSISRVSRMKITSKPPEKEVGTMLDILGGKIIEKKRVNSSDGTKIEIMDLFFNIPARRKFLKSDSAEGRYVTEIIEKFAFTNNINLTYIRDHKEIYKFSSDMDLITKCLKIYPELKRDDLIEIEHNDSLCKISGVISQPKVGRNNRTAQHFFVNNRYIKAASLYSVLEKGYGEMLEKSVHPYGIIFIEIPPDMVDVNVHPQKLEVKFTDEQMVASLLKKVVRESLKKNTHFTMEFISSSDTPATNNENSSFPFQNLYNKKESSQKVEFSQNTTNTDYLQNMDEFFNSSEIEDLQEPYTHFDNNYKLYEPSKTFDFKGFEYQKNQTFTPVEKIDSADKLRILGIVAERYLVVEGRDKLLLVDFHAAHERYIYEILKENLYEKGGLTSDLLLTPVKITLDEVRKGIILENKDHLEKLGIKLEEDEKEIIVKGLPSLVKIDDTEKLIFEIADDLRISNFDQQTNILDKNLATMACRAAVKTKDNPTGMETLLNNIFEKKLLTCPHGRPIMLQITFKTIDKYFERI